MRLREELFGCGDAAHDIGHYGAVNCCREAGLSGYGRDDHGVCTSSDKRCQRSCGGRGCAPTDAGDKAGKSISDLIVEIVGGQQVDALQQKTSSDQTSKPMSKGQQRGLA